jgi:hypothetical protein
VQGGNGGWPIFSNPKPEVAPCLSLRTVQGQGGEFDLQCPIPTPAIAEKDFAIAGAGLASLLAGTTITEPASRLTVSFFAGPDQLEGASSKLRLGGDFAPPQLGFRSTQMFFTAPL